MPTTDPFSRSYDCWQNAPLSCDRPLKTAQDVPNANFCSHCAFPATLSKQVEIRGSRGVYRVLEFVRSQGMGRLYKGVRVSDGSPVVIKEYLLPSRCFNAEEAQERKATFTQIAGTRSIDNQSPDFRLIVPWEAIADRQSDRCYLITLGDVAIAPNLSQVLQQNGEMPTERVRDWLAQVLQTLHFLHTQKLQLPSGRVRTGMAHGNLNLESLILTRNSYIYTCDLASWERLFDPPPNTFAAPEPAQDLVALGHVAFYLGLGRAMESTSEQPPDPHDTQLWSNTDPALREFLYHLLGLETPFPSAEVARQALLKLSSAKLAVTAPRTHKGKRLKKRRRQLLWLVGLLLVLLLGGLLWLVLPKPPQIKGTEFAEFWRLVPSFKEVNTILPPGSYPYTAEEDGTWTTVLGKTPLRRDRTLNDILTRPRTDIAAEFNYIKHEFPVSTTIEQNKQANFAVTSLIDKLPDTLDKPIAFDGLLVFVPTYKSQNLPTALEGKISIEDVQKIFTGQVKNWQDLNPNLPNLKVIPYRPVELEALKIFEQKVLNDRPELIAKFEQVEQRPTSETIRATEFLQLEPGAISFGTLVQTWNQCKVYPLALARGKEQPVQALLRRTTEGKLIPITPASDRCRKTEFSPNIDAFRDRTYPLGFPLAIVYPNDNSLPGFKSGPMFADLLKTRDGQYLLQQNGLVPLQSIPRDYKPSESLLHS
ncbi:MAG: hypothetical protein CLLPBCKN_006958 [Chroococcidiopsis cubana SAG 39.79]|uniref:Serine/threonine protein kinase n=1 Tax=Chroococcidiopsis cubana SAG 39.79 TaxID=388085 RepID=A0AB37UA77_9CYAN|nr:substrate-binding domain-containing protein [Chroococcidiopsis cubana]MDZ4877523.1 hypothetical protein [Chroococcidiopsis cubana SAG 39.79]PSB60190.1 serine/threonine protein kinase [Chroococcidiopsis cubana CCALA 043]RUT01159.1 serine/threonine protein kinase [Chroococcidiopsis cubana SAG 39.79]